MLLIVASVTFGVGIAVLLVVAISPANEQVPRRPEVEGERAARSPHSAQAGGDLEPIYKRFRALGERLTPSGYAARLQRRLDLAGNPQGWSADRVLAFKGIGLSLGVVLGSLYGFRYGVGLVVVIVLAAGLVGFYLPDIWVRNLGERRQIEIRKGLADVIDMITVCVEAGLGFDAALGRVAQNIRGPAGQEFARVMQEMQFGKSRTDALRAAATRTEIPEHKAFVSAIVQSTELGISIGDVLRAQAGQMRIKRRQRAEEAAQKLPVKILAPLILCILPPMFVVVLGPAVLGIIRFFSGGS